MLKVLIQGGHSKGGSHGSSAKWNTPKAMSDFERFQTTDYANNQGYSRKRGGRGGNN